MSKLNEITSDMKPKMTDCRVFYIHIGDLQGSAIDDIIRQFRKGMEEQFDIRNVIFVPTRSTESGWQYPQQ